MALEEEAEDDLVLPCTWRLRGVLAVMAKSWRRSVIMFLSGSTVSSETCLGERNTRSDLKDLVQRHLLGLSKIWGHLFLLFSVTFLSSFFSFSGKEVFLDSSDDNFDLKFLTVECKSMMKLNIMRNRRDVRLAHNKFHFVIFIRCLLYSISMKIAI